MGTESLEVHSSVIKSADETIRNVRPEAFRGLVTVECDQQTETLETVMRINGDAMERSVGVDVSAVSVDLAKEHEEAIENLRKQVRRSTILLSVLPFILVAIVCTALELSKPLGPDAAVFLVVIGIMVLALVRLNFPSPAELRNEIEGRTAEKTFRSARAEAGINVLVLGREGFGFMISDQRPHYVPYTDVSAVWQNRSDNKVRMSFKIENGSRTVILHRPDLEGGSDLGSSREKVVVNEIAARIAAAKGYGESKKTREV